MLPLGAILRHHSLSYHIYANDNPIYLPFETTKPLEAIDKLNTCITYLRSWMQNNKLKMNDSKTGFIVIPDEPSAYPCFNIFIIVILYLIVCQ